MKKLLLSIGFALFAFNIFAQLQPIELSGVKLDSVQINGGVWITEVSNDASLSDSSESAVVTESALKGYIDNNVSPITQASVDSLADTTALHNTRIKYNRTEIEKLNDSIASHTDSLQDIRADISAHEDSLASHFGSITTNSDSITVLRLDINANTGSVDALYDSIMSHTDTLQALRVEINDIINNGAGSVVLDTFTTIAPLITCTRDVLISSDSSDYELVIFSGDEFDGRNLVDLECSSMRSDGTAAVTVDAYRLRGATEVKMTSVGASFSASATVNTSNDDVQAGDKIRFKWTIGGGTPPIGLKVKPKFQ